MMWIHNVEFPHVHIYTLDEFSGSVADGKHWAKVSKRGITERKRAKIENPHLNAHLHINMNSYI